MKFGLYAPIPMATVGSPEVAQAVSEARQPLPPGRRDAQFDLCEDLLLTADDHGFDLVLFAERHLGHDLSAWILASAVGSQFKRIRPLVAVHPGLVDPVMVAKLAASLDRICVGRIAINIVNGWFDREFTLFGGKVLKDEDRYRRATEFMEIMRRLWRGERFDYAGDHYRLTDAELMLTPASPAAPEFFSVSTSDAGRDFVARTCDCWFVQMPKDVADPDDAVRQVESAIKDMRRRAEREGRSIRFALNPFLALGSDSRSAYETALERIAAYTSDRADIRLLPATKLGCMGSPSDVRDQVRRYGEVGIDLLLLKIIPTAENVKLIAQEILAST